MRLIKFSLVIILTFVVHIGFAQTCSSCSINITGTSTSAYTVGTGAFLCLDSTAKFTGTIILDGGTLCIRGLFRPQLFIFNSGAIMNYGNVAIIDGIILSTGKSIESEKKAFTKIQGSLGITGGYFINKGIATVRDTINFTTGGFDNSGVINCGEIGSIATGAIDTGVINRD